MAKLFSVCCGPLPVLLLVLVVASVPVMALDFVEPLVELFEKVTPYALREMEAPEDFIKGVKTGFKNCNKIMKKVDDLQQNSGTGGDEGGATTTYYFFHNASGDITAMRLPVVTADITARPAASHGFCGADLVGLDHDDVQMKTIRLFGMIRRGNQSQSLMPVTPPFSGMVTVYPAVPAAPKLAVVGLGRGGNLSKRFPTFTYLTRHDGRAILRLPMPTAAAQQQGRHLGESSQLATTTTTIPLCTNPKFPRDSRYYVEVTGIRVGEEVVETTTELGFRPDGTGGVYLSTTKPYTYLESCVYLRLKAAFMSQIQRLNPKSAPIASSLEATGKLCYVRTELTVPSMAILFAGGNAVMKLGAATNVWYREGSSTVCLAILPTNLSSPGDASVLGSWLQSGRTMTIDVTPGTPGTLTF